jgi:hypothetical protein
MLQRTNDVDRWLAAVEYESRSSENDFLLDTNKHPAKPQRS